jgi:threonine/homoserine/homoserine lactone efflux protein
MKDSTVFWPIEVGFVVGWLYFILLGNWLRRFLTVIGRPLPTGKRQPGAEVSRFGLVIAAIHPAPWLLLIGVPYGFIHFHGRPAEVQWLWFVGSAFVTWLGLFTFALLISRRNYRRALATAKAKATGGEHVA